MVSLYFTLHTHLKLMVLPDTMKHLNGHMVITDTYSIFEAQDTLNPRLQQVKEKEMHRVDNDNAGYLGYLRIDIPDKLFSYVAADHSGLESNEVEELIELLTELRSNPGLWPI